ncbi:MAG: sugar phosphate isomerase/epimerase [Verrucomicrobiae bacterium]|nr:sugar phosphate isomerase/epimerase [Verrucomicrobiae bacterium]
MKLSRRKWFERVGIGASAVAFSSAVSPLFSASNSRRFKIGACEWSLRKGDPSCFDVAKEIGLDGVQVDLGHPGNGLHLRKTDVQKAYIEASKKTGVEIASLAMAVLNNIPLKSEPCSALWVLDAIESAKALNVKVILIAQFGNGELKDDKKGIERTVAVLKELAPRAEKSGIILGIENYLSAEENLDIINRVGSKAVQVYYDVGNSTDKGYDIYKEIRMLKGQICEIHFKDGGFMLGKGRIDFKRVREALDEIEYSGWTQLECAAPKSLVPDYREQLAFVRSIFGS